MTARQWGLLGVLAILWGVPFLFSKMALAELPPFTLVLGRFGLAALALVTLLMPVVALAAGALLLGESVTTTALAGMGLIAGGLLAIDGRLLPVRRVAVEPPGSGAPVA
jgi:drug/metabolite transporter (DMT)-like permease